MSAPLVAAAALGAVAYTYVGYPALVAALARLRPLTLDEDPAWEPSVSALVPVFDAERYVEEKVRSLLALDWPADKLELLFFCDGCSDGSVAILERLAAEDARVRVVVSAERRGKPTGLNELRRLARGEVLLLTDVRQPLEPGALRALTRKLADPRVGCVSGNLVLRGATGAGAYWRYENWIRASEARFRGMVGVTGPIYAVRARDLPDLPTDLILDDMWVPLRLRLEGRLLVLAEDAVAWDEAFEDERERGRKARTLAGNYQLYARMPELLDPQRNPSFFEVVSHKVLRLACPFALGALAASTAWIVLAPSGRSPLVRAGARALAGGQLAFYALAAAGGAAGKAGTVARTFVLLNTAAVEGLVRHLRGSQRVTW